jgi:diguanylate cyclase (GGDEF)-like protein
MIGWMTVRPPRRYLFCGFLLAASAPMLAALWRGPALTATAGFACALVVLAAVRSRRPRSRAAWYLLSAGVATLAVSSIFSPDPATLGLADGLRFAGYLVLALGVGLLIEARSSGRDWSGLIDACAATAAAALLCWVALIAPELNEPPVSAQAKLIALLYPLTALVLLAVAARLALGLRAWTEASVMLGLALGFLVAAQLTSTVLRLHGSASSDWLATTELLAAFSFLALASLEPSMRELGAAASERDSQLTAGRVGLLAAAALAAPWLMAEQATRDAGRLDIAATVALSSLVTGLVLARLAGLVVGQQRTSRRELLLRQAMRELASADEHEAVCEAAVGAAAALAGEHGRVRASLILGSGRSAIKFATSGESVSQPQEVSIPLSLQEERIGELVLESERPLAAEVVLALESLASQVILALESLQRTKTLLEERRELESELMRRSHLDSLTALPNRSHFLERVEVALTRIQRTGEPVSVMVVNLDDFKTVNDTLGHVAGDELLKGVSDRLVASIRTDDTCARLGSDEWAILIEESPPESPSVVAERIMTALERSFVLLGQHEVFAHASIGAATAPPEYEGDTDAPELLRNAEVAMFHAKRHGRTGFEAFEPAMRAAVAERLALKAELERAVAASEFVIHYQPIVLLESGGICGLEALVRWNHPERGLIPPFHFIPLAEETGLIVPLGRFVLHEALRQGRHWQELTALPELVISVNISGRQLDHSLFVSDVAQAIERTAIDPHTVILEITETALMEDVESAIERLHELKTLGVQVAIDDFGTGYSSLQYLRQFPADIIKVAKPFVDGVVEAGSDEYRIADAIVRLGETFGLRALAEGIELPEQRDMLRDLRCELGQGFLFARPLEPGKVEELLLAADTETPIPA